LPEDPQPPEENSRPIRRFRIGTNVGIQILLALVLCGIANYLSFRHYARWDLTSSRDHTLSSATLNFLGKLDKNAKIVVAFARGHELFDEIRILVEEYARNSGGRIEVEFVDPARAPDRAEELKNRYEFTLERNALIVDMDGRTRFIDEEELATYNTQDFKTRRITQFHGEDALTSALISVSEPQQQRLYLISGKGKLRTSETGDAAGVLQAFCKRQNIVLDTVNLADVRNVPGDANGLVLIAPKFDLTRGETRILRDYWDSKRGSLLVFLDPDSQTPNLYRFLITHGISPRDDRILYAESTPAGPAKQFTVQSDFIPGSPVTRDLAGVTTAFSGQTQSLALDTENDELKQKSFTITPLLQATKKYWGETRYEQTLPTIDERDYREPLYTAAAVERGAVKDVRIRIDSSRMVIVANPTLLDPDVSREPNHDFVFSSINWLLDRDELIGITPKIKSTYSLPITDEERSRVFTLVAIVLPACVIFFGIFVWGTRRT